QTATPADQASALLAARAKLERLREQSASFLLSLSLSLPLSACLLRCVICHITASSCGTKKEQVIIPATLELYLQGRSLSDGITRDAEGGKAMLRIVCAILLIRGPFWAAQSRCTSV